VTTFPRFIVLESTEEKPITKLSPFAIEKFLSANVAPKSVKATRNNTLIVEVAKKKYADLLLKMTTFHNMKIKAYPHRSLNISRGVVRSSQLSSCSIEEIKLNLKKQQVSEVKRITIRKNDQLIDTNTYILTFNTPKPPPKLKIGYMMERVETYIPNPLRCYNCQKYGHHESRCTRKKICKKCGEDGSDHPESTCNQIKCANCKGDHSVDSRICEAWKREKEIMKIKYTQDIPFPEARKLVESTFPARSYSRVTQPLQNPPTPECHKCNSLIEKLLNLKPEEFPTLIRELQNSIPQTKQPPPSNTTPTVNPIQKEQMTPLSLQSQKPSQGNKDPSKQRPSRSPTKQSLSMETSPTPKERTPTIQKHQDKSRQRSQSRHKTQENKTSNESLETHNKFEILTKMETEENPQPTRHNSQKTFKNKYIKHKHGTKHYSMELPWNQSKP